MAKKQSSGLYRARLKIGTDAEGKDIYKYISGRTRKELEQARAAAYAYYIDGAAAAEDRLFGDYAVQWFKTIKAPRLAPQTQANWRSVMNLYVLPPLGGRQLRAITATDLQAILNDLRGRDRSTLIRARAAMRGVFRQAVKDRIIRHDPSQYLDLPEARKPDEKRALTPEERAAAERVIRTHEDGLYLALLYYLGIRKGELHGLRWGDIDWSSGTVHIQRQITGVSGTRPMPLKTRHSDRVIPIPAPLRELLLPQRSLPDYYIVHGARPQDPVREKNHAHRFAALMAACGLAGITAHAFRHNYVTMLWESGIDVYTAMRLAGHANIQTTMNVYTHLTNSKQQAIAAQIDAVFNRRCTNVANPN